MPAAVAGVAVVADPAVGRAGLVLARLRPLGEAVDVVPVTSRGEIRNDVEREPERVLSVDGVHSAPREAIGDEDLVLAAKELDVLQEPAVDLLAGEARDVDELPPPVVWQTNLESSTDPIFAGDVPGTRATRQDGRDLWKPSLTRRHRSKVLP